ncbi:hypothetical protein Cni_G10394 [Canna indica]|uniref:Uncharacterized protein n=1 Tax=Canna indica TaxID=4628 RepID=A0AAQ3K4A7_9LILI|nr:hypothetical protein Cni_G10394 [Canna indica]
MVLFFSSQESMLVPITGKGNYFRAWDFSEINVGQVPWLIIGDMNCIKNGKEKLGGREFNNSKASKDFNNFIKQNGFFEASFTGAQYTWANNRKRDACIQARLDMAIYNEYWLNRNIIIKVKHLQRIKSDHRPILVSCEKEKGFKYKKSLLLLSISDLSKKVSKR